MQAIQKYQDTETVHRQTIRQQTLEIEKLKAQVTGDEPEADGTDNPRSAKKAKSSSQSADIKQLRKDALQAGKRYAVCNSLWMNPGAIRYLALLKGDNADDELEEPGDPDESDEDNEMKEQAQGIYHSLPAHLRPHVEKPWFKERVSLPFTFLSSSTYQNMSSSKKAPSRFAPARLIHYQNSFLLLSSRSFQLNSVTKTSGPSCQRSLSSWRTNDFSTIVTLSTLKRL